MHTALGHVQAGQGAGAPGAAEWRGQGPDRDGLQRVHSPARRREQHRVRAAVEEADSAGPCAAGAGQPGLWRVQAGLRGGDEADAGGGGQEEEAAPPAGEAGHTGGGAAAPAESVVCGGAQAAADDRECGGVVEGAAGGALGAAEAGVHVAAEWGGGGGGQGRGCAGLGPREQLRESEEQGGR